MNKKKNVVMIICVLAVIILLLALVLGRTQKETPAANVPQDMTVETPYGTLYYPGEWTDRVYAEVTQEDTVTAAFYGLSHAGEEFRLFDVIFGGSEEGALGTITLESGETCPVSVRIYDAEAQNISGEKDFYEFNAMQEAINYLIGKLPMDDQDRYSTPEKSSAVVQNQRPAVYADVKLETPYATVAYPGELAGKLHVEMGDGETYPVTFCWNQGDTLVRLFEISFGGEEGALMGYLADSGTPVHVTVFDVTQEANLDQEELDTALSLQEALNDVLARLPMQSEIEKETGFLTYETPYGTLVYPDEYQQHLEVEVRETEPCIVSFRFLGDNAANIPLFDVIFGGEEGIPVGVYTGEDGVSVTVHLMSYSIPEGALLGEGEQNLYYEMAEGVNFLFDNYQEMYGFEIQ